MIFYSTMQCTSTTWTICFIILAEIISTMNLFNVCKLFFGNIFVPTQCKITCKFCIISKYLILFFCASTIGMAGRIDSIFVTNLKIIFGSIKTQILGLLTKFFTVAIYVSQFLGLFEMILCLSNMFVNEKKNRWNRWNRKIIKM